MKEQGFGLQASAKTLEGKQHPDREAQFRYLNEQVKEHQSAGQPVISIDAEKKEQLGRSPNPGRQWRPAGDPVQVEDRSFYFTGPDVEVAIPFGIYDLANDSGWVNVGTDHDTSVFAVESIRRWWQAPRPDGLPERRTLVDHRGLRRVQQLPLPVMEGRTRRLGRPDGPDRDRLPFSTGHLEMEQDRTPAVLPHHRERARKAPDQPRGRRQQHRRNPDQNGPASTRRVGHLHLPPVGVSVSRDHLRSLPLTPHDQHGTWNYTISATSDADDNAPGINDRDRTRAQVLTMLADPRLSGMTASELETLCDRLAPSQAARAEQRKFQQRGGRRRQPRKHPSHKRVRITHAQ